MSLMEGNFTPSQREQLNKWKEARARLNAGKPKLVEAPKPTNIIVLVPPTRDPKKEVMDFIIAAVANSYGLPVNEILGGFPSPEIIAARKLAMGFCVRRPRLEIKYVAAYFEVVVEAVKDALLVLDPILARFAVTSKVPIELSLPAVIGPWKEEMSDRNSVPRILDIQKAFCAAYAMRRIDMLSSRKTLAIARPRMAAMALAKHKTFLSYAEIGRRFGGKDHTTVMHAVRKMDTIIERVSKQLTDDAPLSVWATTIRTELEFLPNVGWGA